MKSNSTRLILTINALLNQLQIRIKFAAVGEMIDMLHTSFGCVCDDKQHRIYRVLFMQ